MNLPRRVPRLEARHICKGAFFVGHKKCLSSWRDRIFTSYCPEVREAFLTEAPLAPTEAISTWNDSHTEQECADLWNRTMLRLGYLDATDRFIRPECQ